MQSQSCPLYLKVRGDCTWIPLLSKLHTPLERFFGNFLQSSFTSQPEPSDPILHHHTVKGQEVPCPRWLLLPFITPACKPPWTVFRINLTFKCWMMTPRKYSKDCIRAIKPAPRRNPPFSSKVGPVYSLGPAQTQEQSVMLSTTVGC